MSTFTIANRNVPANVVAHTPVGVRPPVRVQSAEIQLTDPTSSWPASVDVTRHVLIWGLQISADSTDGTDGTWAWGPVWQGSLTDSTQWLAFGSRDRHGGLPALGWKSSNSPFQAGAWVRLAIQTDAAVNLGASVTTA
jgi:hypothetical protein